MEPGIRLLIVTENKANQTELPVSSGIFTS